MSEDEVKEWLIQRIKDVWKRLGSPKQIEEAVLTRELLAEIKSRGPSLRDVEISYADDPPGHVMITVRALYVWGLQL